MSLAELRPGNLKGHSPGSGRFRCGCPKTEANSQSTNWFHKPRCKTCYRAYMRQYMRERYWREA